MKFLETGLETGHHAWKILETGDFNKIFFHPLENFIKITGFKDFASVVPGFKAGFKDFQAVSRLSSGLGPIRANS